MRGWNMQGLVGRQARRDDLDLIWSSTEWKGSVYVLSLLSTIERLLYIAGTKQVPRTIDCLTMSLGRLALLWGVSGTRMTFDGAGGRQRSEKMEG